MKCAIQDKLRADAADALGRIVMLGNEQVDCLKANNQTRLLELDKELELAFGDKERAFGALRQHQEEHRC